MTLFTVRIKEVVSYGSYNWHVYLIEAKSKNHAKNLAEAKWYESNNASLSEGETEVWEIEGDYSGRENPNPSVRN